MSAGRILVYATIVSTFFLICWGAYLTAGNYGAGCGPASSNAISNDWPYCNGSLAIPNPSTPAGYAALIEYIHRTLSVLVGVILIATLVVVARMKPRPTGTFRALLLSGVLLLIQIGLGNVVVNTALNSVWTAVHLGERGRAFRRDGRRGRPDSTGREGGY